MTTPTAQQTESLWGGKKPAYGMIPFFGKAWSVTYEPKGSCSHKVLSGYGDFPFERFPGLPVIDLRDDDRVDQWLSRPNWDESPADCLVTARKMGLTILCK